MKSEKEFLAQVWTAIEQEQTDDIQEQMVIERGRRHRNLMIKMGVIFALCSVAVFIAVFIIITQVPKFAYSGMLIYGSAFLIILFAFVLEKLSFREVENGNRNSHK